MTALKYLKKQEWSMGNGQCPECYGVSPKWLGHPLHLDSSTIGHKPGCQMAESLSSLGATPVMIGEFVSNKVYECYITNSGIFSTRPKTKNGCSKLRTMNKKFDAILFDAIFGETVKNSEKI
ncbi:MAG: hypothetical protein SV062_08205 [Thermodesulfobacteriota bacterium]|nr:hypothetical protein [Thermodesulfobacteriota bacterium]